MKLKFLATFLAIYTGSAFCEISYTGFSGNNLMDWSKIEKSPGGQVNTEDALNNFLFYGYVAGVHDSAKMTKRFCSPPGVQLPQLVAVVSKYLENDPKNWNMPAWYLTLKAFEEAWPCTE